MKEKIDRLTIGKLATASNVSVETIRFYERKELIKQPEKQGGFRYYPTDLIKKIWFIKRSQELGFTLKEVKELLELTVKKKSRCNDILIRTETKIDEINEKIKDLKRMKKSLEGLAKCCDSREMPLSDCPVLDCFIDSK
ncbi:MAG: hypothetical protein BM556_18065 [Bacteriovorax sp. MedPE-SWde]|nr:MAG: hypothetical protein BM556_18065 [Bacteriovorax sp. MedPE-SWde]